MALTREFQETLRARAQHDAAFRSALLSEAAEAILAGEADTARLVLRDYINATLGFETLATETGIPVKSLHRMFGPRGNPTLGNLSSVLKALETNENISFRVEITRA